MATADEIRNDLKYIRVHNAGFVGLVDHMGTDDSICQAARVSYGAGTKSVSDDRGLIRYLLRHKHTTPFEMCEVKFHMKLPIFVARQLIRHRTASVNEYSGRYSEMPDEFYIPDDVCLQPQSQTNKQGRDGELTQEHKNWIKSCLTGVFQFTYSAYRTLMNPGEDYNGEVEIPTTRLHDSSYPGLTRELSRITLPVANYTEWYWKIDLHNLFHFLRLRLDPHAQKEIRDFAEAMYALVKPIYPIACEAFEDYSRQAKTFSRMEVELLQWYFGTRDVEEEDIIEKAKQLKMSKREIDEFLSFYSGN